MKNFQIEFQQNQLNELWVLYTPLKSFCKPYFIINQFRWKFAFLDNLSVKAYHVEFQHNLIDSLWDNEGVYLEIYVNH
jgi:hypothetical protein